MTTPHQPKRLQVWCNGHDDPSYISKGYNSGVMVMMTDPPYILKGYNSGIMTMTTPYQS